MKKIFLFLIIALFVSYVSIQFYKYSIPKQGKILRYENFRGYSVPIIADGRGGFIRMMKDVPWKMFTIEEKFNWAKAGGGYLSDDDIREIKLKYGAR